MQFDKAVAFLEDARRRDARIVIANATDAMRVVKEHATVQVVNVAL